MTKLRLLPIVLFATTALLAIKILTFVTGTGSFAVGPVTAVAAESGGHGGGEEANPVTEPQGNFEDPLNFEPPLDLAKEAEDMAKQPEAAAGGHGGGHEAPKEGEAAGHGEAPAHGETPPADAHGEAPPADAHGEAPPADAHGETPPADAAGHGETPPADAAAHGETPPADAAAHGEAPPADAHGETPPADAAAHGETPPADAAAHGEAPPAEGGHAAPAEGGHAAPAEGGHGAPKLPAGVSTERPEEFQPDAPKTESAILEALAARRQQLDKREADIELRMKLLDATEKRLQDRVDELKSIQSQIGMVNGGAPAPGGADGKTDPAAPDGAKEPDPATKGLVSMYETMKPKSAAAVFNTLDLPVLLPLVRNINPRKMAPILAAMEPEKAGRLTAALTAIAMQQPVVVHVDGGGDMGAPSDPAAQPATTDLPKIMPADPASGG